MTPVAGEGAWNHSSASGLRRKSLVIVVAACLSAAGCTRAAPPQYVTSKETQALSPELQKQISEHLQKLCGSPSQPRLLGNDKVDERHLRRGAEVYQKRCAACHGTTGDGNGPAAEAMNPKPRDYRRGIFKFTSTPYGAKPLRADLLHTIRYGVKGTSMPEFKLLDEADLQAVLDYVLVLTHRGELELLLAATAEAEDELDPAAIPELAQGVVDQWTNAKSQKVLPLTREVPLTAESIEIGKKAFLSETAGCFKCHGPDGRGQTSDNEKGFTDVWGRQTRAADLTSGMFRGGGQPDDIYRRMYSGINGTPMPSFSLKLQNEPDTFWHLVHYVQYVSSARRRALPDLTGEHEPARDNQATKSSSPAGGN